MSDIGLGHIMLYYVFKVELERDFSSYIRLDCTFDLIPYYYKIGFRVGKTPQCQNLYPYNPNIQEKELLSIWNVTATSKRGGLSRQYKKDEEKGNIFDRRFSAVTGKNIHMYLLVTKSVVDSLYQSILSYFPRIQGISDQSSLFDLLEGDTIETAISKTHCIGNYLGSPGDYDGGLGDFTYRKHIESDNEDEDEDKESEDDVIFRLNSNVNELNIWNSES